LLLARLCWLEMYSRKFGLRLHGKCRKSFENPPSLRLPAWQAADYPPRRAGSGCHGSGGVVADWVICGTRMRSRFYVNESSFRLTAETSRLAACAPQNAKLAKAFGVTAAAAEQSPFLCDELSAGSPGCGNDLVEALITAQRIPARIEAEITICQASRDFRDNFVRSKREPSKFASPQNFLLRATYQKRLRIE
jgi:hypothetical protein